jgi:hypothetical protein
MDERLPGLVSQTRRLRDDYEIHGPAVADHAARRRDLSWRQFGAWMKELS